MNSLTKNLVFLKSQLKDEVNLLAVSKTFSTKLIIEAYEAGQRDFGENRIMELLSKAEELSHLNISWHFIGKLQSNKINALLKVKNLVAIHSIDSHKLLQKILNKERGTPLGLFLQFNSSGEEEKSGFKGPGDLKKAVSLILESEKSFFLQGLMTMGKLRTKQFEEDAKKCFQLLSSNKESLDREFDLSLELSMGMSRDFKIAQNCGSDWVRIGRELFRTS